MLALNIKDLKKTYPNGTHALEGINLAVQEGEFLGLLGPNGAGKSTTINIINSLTRKTSGEVSIFGDDIDMAQAHAKTHIGVVPQEFNFGVFEKVKHIVINQAGYYGINRSEATVRAKKYLSLLELWDKRDVMARTLSGGMKRRLMIARALMHEPRLLILDEPTAGVDVEIRRSMWELMKQLNAGGKTIILTTHYLEEAESLCDRIAIINHGKIVQDTSKKVLLSQLNLETFVFDLAEPLKSELSKPQNFILKKVDPMTLSVDLEKGTHINAVFDYFDKHCINVISMRNQTNRLEELFIHLTKKKKER